MGRRGAGRLALHPGYRGRRRMGWLGPVVDGMGAHEQKSRGYRGVAAIWRSDGLLPRQPRDPGVQSAVARPVSKLGLARPVLAEPHHGRHRAVDPARHSRDADLSAGARRGRVARTPVVEVFKRQPKEVFLTAFARMAQMVVIYVYTAFVFTYGMQSSISRKTSSCLRC